MSSIQSRPATAAAGIGVGRCSDAAAAAAAIAAACGKPGDMSAAAEWGGGGGGGSACRGDEMATEEGMGGEKGPRGMGEEVLQLGGEEREGEDGEEEEVGVEAEAVEAAAAAAASMCDRCRAAAGKCAATAAAAAAAAAALCNGGAPPPTGAAAPVCAGLRPPLPLLPEAAPLAAALLFLLPDAADTPAATVGGPERPTSVCCVSLCLRRSTLRCSDKKKHE